jgi:sugar-specific transcriptional regulator TrmB
VKTTDERPARYTAIDLSLVFDQELETRMRAIDALRETRAEIEGLLTAVRPEGIRPPQSTYQVIRGRKEIYRVRRMLVAHAKKTLDWATTFGPALRLWTESGERDQVLRRVEEGLHVRALVPEGPDTPEVFAPFAKRANVEVRSFEAKGLVRFLLADNADLLMFVVNDENTAMSAEDEVAIHTTAPGFLYAQRVFFEQSWAAAPAARLFDV